MGIAAGRAGSGAAPCHVADFAAAGLDGVLGPGSAPALVLVDPAAAYVLDGSPLRAEVSAAVAGMRRLLAAVRRYGLPVYITRVLHEHPGDGGLFARKVPATRVWAKGSPYTEFIPGLGPGKGETLITKQYPSAFFGTPLASLLTSGRIDTVIIAGLTTSGCIRATALDALQHGFIPLVVEDAVGDRHQGIHDANLLDIRAKIADVVTLDETEDYLSSLHGGAADSAAGRLPVPQSGTDPTAGNR